MRGRSRIGRRVQRLLVVGCKSLSRPESDTASPPPHMQSLKEDELPADEAIRWRGHGLTSANDYDVSQVISCFTSSDSSA